MSAPTAGTPFSPDVPPATAGSPSDPIPSSPPAPSPVSASPTDTPATPAVPAHAPDSAAKAERQTLDDSVKMLTEVQQSPEQEREARDLAITERLSRGTPYREICADFGVSISTVSRIAARMAEFDAGAVSRLMASKTLHALEAWEKAMETGAKAGKHAPARDWLTHARVLDPVQSEGGAGGAKVAIIIGQPGQPITHDSPQVIDVQVVSAHRDE